MRVIGASVLVADQSYHGGRCGPRYRIVRPAPSVPVGQCGGAVPTVSREAPQAVAWFTSLYHLAFSLGQNQREETGGKASRSHSYLGAIADVSTPFTVPIMRVGFRVSARTIDDLLTVYPLPVLVGLT